MKEKSEMGSAAPSDLQQAEIVIATGSAFCEESPILIWRATTGPSAAGQREAKMEEQAHEPMVEDTPTAGDVDSQPLSDLGVSFMNQDELEKNVAAQVWTFSFSLDLALMAGGCSYVETRR